MNYTNLSKYDYFNLKEVIIFLQQQVPALKQVYLFGSRAYKTGSPRSDIDLLAIVGSASPDLPLRDNLHLKFPPVDLFLSSDGKSARSYMNGSMINLREDNDSLFLQLDAILLWDHEIGFEEKFNDWNQSTLAGIDFKMSIIPSQNYQSFESLVGQVLDKVRDDLGTVFFSGESYEKISENIIKILKQSFTKPLKFSKKAKSFSFDSLILKNEYDFQNYIHMLLRLIYPSIQPEPFVVEFEGSAKNADFSLCDGAVILEAKYIDDKSKKATVLKSIEGLIKIYQRNPRVEVIIFPILYEEGLEIDPEFLKSSFNRKGVYVEFFKNIFH